MHGIVRWSVAALLRFEFGSVLRGIVQRNFAHAWRGSFRAETGTKWTGISRCSIRGAANACPALETATGGAGANRNAQSGGLWFGLRI